MKSGRRKAGIPFNAIPSDANGVMGAAPTSTPPVDNTLTDKEKRDGWQLLFDGQRINGWHN